MYIFSQIFKKRELRENMYSAKISTFTVTNNPTPSINRFGGLSFGERNPLVRVNETELAALARRIATAANGRVDPGLNISANGTNNVFEDLEQVLASLSTQKNAKVWCSRGL